MLADLWLKWGDGVIWIVVYTAAGFAVDQLVFFVLTKQADHRHSRTLQAIADGVRWLPTALGFVFGMQVGVGHIALDGKVSFYGHLAPGLLLVLVMTVFSARILGRVVGSLTAREDNPLPSGSIFVNLVRAAVWILGSMWVLSMLGVSLAPLITALGVGGLAVGLALQPTLENMFSGIQLITSGQIKPGDFIRLDTGDEGTVLDVTWRNTTVQKLTNDVVIVPNSVLARATVTNFTTVEHDFVLIIPVSFASAGDPDVVERLALEVAREVIAEVPQAIPNQAPTATFAELTPPAAVLNIAIRCSSYQDRIPVRHEFIRRLAKRFAEEGVQAPPVPLQAAIRR
jgi:small-conductance mechanosensitive channel